MSDGLLARWWPILYQTSLPRHPEPEEEQSEAGERIAGLVDECN